MFFHDVVLEDIQFESNPNYNCVENTQSKHDPFYEWVDNTQLKLTYLKNGSYRVKTQPISIYFNKKLYILSKENYFVATFLSIYFVLKKGIPNSINLCVRTCPHTRIGKLRGIKMHTN